MALVSEQVGANEFQQFRQSLESFLLGALGIVSEKTHQFGYTDESMDGVKALLDHIKGGKDVSLQLVEGEDASLFASILKHNGIPYVEVTDGAEPDGRHIFMVRGTDTRKLEMVWDQYAAEISKGLPKEKPTDIPQEADAPEKQRRARNTDIDF